MSERHITFSPDAKFIDPDTEEPVRIVGPDWKQKIIAGPNGEPLVSKPTEDDMIDHPERSFEWFLNVYILTHQIFSFDFGGYEATKAMKEISKSCEQALEAGASFMTVTADQDRMIKFTMAKCPKKDRDDKYARVLSSLGMTRQMDNFVSGCFCEHMDALQNSSTNKPTQPALPPAQSAAMEPEEEATSVAN